MNNRNVATKEIFSVIDSKHDSASDISTQPELSEHSGWQRRGFGKPKNHKKGTKPSSSKKNKNILRQKEKILFSHRL